MAWRGVAFISVLWRAGNFLCVAFYFQSRRCGQFPAHSWSVVTCRVLMHATLHVLVVSLIRVASLSLVLEVFWLTSNFFFSPLNSSFGVTGAGNGAGCGGRGSWLGCG